MEEQVSVGRVKRDISELLNRVAYGGETIVITSRGKPKAALVSMEDYARLAAGAEDTDASWSRWEAECDALARDIVSRNKGPIDVDALWRAARADLEERDVAHLGG